MTGYGDENGWLVYMCVVMFGRNERCGGIVPSETQKRVKNEER